LIQEPLLLLTIDIEAICYSKLLNFDPKIVGHLQTFVEGASIIRSPLFVGENYPFWKIRMIFLIY